jgi:hypothetical protein
VDAKLAAFFASRVLGVVAVRSEVEAPDDRGEPPETPGRASAI